MDALVRAFTSDDDGVVVTADAGDVVDVSDGGAGGGDGDASDGGSDASDASEGDPGDTVSDMFDRSHVSQLFVLHTEARAQPLRL